MCQTWSNVARSCLSTAGDSFGYKIQLTKYKSCQCWKSETWISNNHDVWKVFHLLGLLLAAMQDLSFSWQDKLNMLGSSYRRQAFSIRDQQFAQTHYDPRLLVEADRRLCVSRFVRNVRVLSMVVSDENADSGTSTNLVRQLLHRWGRPTYHPCAYRYEDQYHGQVACRR